MMLIMDLYNVCPRSGYTTRSDKCHFLLKYGVKSGNLEMVKWLEEHGADWEIDAETIVENGYVDILK